MNAASSDANPKNAVDEVEIPVFANVFLTFSVVALDSFVLTRIATKVSLTSDCPKISLISGFLFDVVVISSINCFCYLRYPSKSNSGTSSIAASPLAVTGAFSLSSLSFSAFSLASFSLSTLGTVIVFVVRELKSYLRIIR